MPDTQQPIPPEQPRRGLTRRARETIQAYLLLAPSTLILIVFNIFAVAYAFYISLHRWRINNRSYIGVGNYVRLLGAPINVVIFLAGLGILIGAYYVWQSAAKQMVTWKIGVRLLVALMLILGGLTLVLGASGMVEYATQEQQTEETLLSLVEDYLLSILRTLFYSMGTVPFQLAIAFLLANLLFQKIRAKSLFRMLYFLPYITPTVATAAVWRATVFDPRRGLVNSLLSNWIAEQNLPQWILESRGITVLIGRWLGVQMPDWITASPFFSGPSLAMIAVCIYNIWVFAGYNTVIYLAGLGAIPFELYEAARIDGAGRWQTLRHITLPMVSPTTYFLTLMGIIGTFKAVNHIYVMTQIVGLGGPQDATTTAAIFIFKQFREGNRWGVASAASFILLGIILLLTWIQNRVAEERVHYG